VGVRRHVLDLVQVRTCGRHRSPSSALDELSVCPPGQKTFVVGPRAGQGIQACSTWVSVEQWEVRACCRGPHPEIMVRFEGGNMQKITPFLWFDDQAEEAANLY